MSEGSLESATAAENRALHALVQRLRSELDTLKQRSNVSAQSEQEVLLRRALIDSSLDSVVIIDKTGVVREFNKTAEEMFGYERYAVLGKKMSELIVPPALRAAHDRGMNHYNETGEGPVLNSRIEITAMNSDGTEFPVELAIVPMEIEGEELFVGWVRDITRRRSDAEALKRSEAQLREAHKMEAVGKLAGGIAHDFNNSLTVMISFAELLRDSLDKPHLASTMLDEILSSAGDAAKLTRQLMAVGRRQLIQLEVLDLTKLVRDTCSMLASSLPDHIVVQEDLSEETLLIRGDVTSLRQVLVNLALNSKHAMPQGGEIRVSLESRQSDATSSRQCVLKIEDTGEGMSKQVAKQAFEPFFTTKELGQGSGLGLSTVYGTIRQLGGDVSLRSEPGIGTAVEITIPLVAVEQEGSSQAPHRVLLVEDQAKLRSVCHLVLERAGFRVESASDGASAIDRLSTGHMPDLIITDVTMPQVGGIELSSWLWERSPELPVLLISGSADTKEIEELLQAGPAKLLAKPFAPQDLVTAAEGLLKASRPADIRDPNTSPPAADT